MKTFFDSSNPEDGTRKMNENSVTGKDAIDNVIKLQLMDLEEIKKLDLKEEAITAKVKELLLKTIENSINLVKGEL